MKITRLIIITTTGAYPTPYSATAMSVRRAVYTAYFREMGEVIAFGRSLGVRAEVGPASQGGGVAHYIENEINASLSAA